MAHAGWYGACSLGGVLYESFPPQFDGERGPGTGWWVPAVAIGLGAIGVLMLTGRSALDPQLSGQLRTAGLFWAQRRIHEVGQVGLYLLQCNPRWLWGWWRQAR